MPNVYELGYDEFLVKSIEDPQTADPDLDLSNFNTDVGATSTGAMSPNTVATALPGGSVDFTQTTMDKIKDKQIMESEVFVSGSSGWQIKGNGDVEFNSGTFRGTVTAGSFVGGSIDIPDTTTANSFHVNSTGNAWWGATAIGSATAKILSTGAATFTTVTLSGSLEVSTSGNMKSGQTAYNTGTGWFMEYNSGTPRFSIGDPAGNYLTWDGTTMTVKGVITATTATIASTTTDTFTINSDLTDSNVDLVFGRTTGGSATMRYNGTTVNIDKSFTVSGTAIVLETRTVTAGAGLTGGGALSSDITITVGAGSGITVNADDVALTTPGTLTVSTSNSSTGNHTHSVTSSSNPGAVASILASTSAGYLQLVRLGLGVSPSFALHVLDTTEQARLAYDGSNYASFTVGSGGNLTIAPTGDFIFDPTGNDILPATGYDLNIGALTKKYLTLHAAELWVETLVAQNTIATIGGRILVGPTTTLTRDLTNVATTIYVKHNEMASGDRTYMEANGSVEFFAITSSATLEVEGDYSYTVTRNLDGSGANTWSAGDAMFNTGAAGDGFIDIYSVNGVKAGSEAGPTIVGNVRNSTTYNDWTSHWAIGNLNGLYGYGVTTYGVAMGEYAASKAHITIDSTNGFRIFTGTGTVVGQWSATGSITVGNTSTEHVSISSTAVQIKDGSTVYADLTAGTFSLGDTSNEHVLINTSGVALKDSSTVYGLFAATTTIGITTSEHVSISSTSVQIKDSSSVYTDLTAGVLTLGLVSGGEYVTVDGTNGIEMYANAVKNISITNAGIVTVGEVGASKSNVQISSGQIALRTNTTNKITLDTSGNINIVGSLIVGTSGNIQSGQTAYNTGAGWFMEYNSGTPRFSIGDGTVANSLTWDGADLKIGGIGVSQGFFAGDGSDGAIDGSANVTITGSNNTVIIKNYSSVAAAQGGGKTFTITPTGCILIIKVQGNADWTNWTFTFTGKGEPGGTAGTGVTGAATNGNAGTEGTDTVLRTIPNMAIDAGNGGSGGTVGPGAAGSAGTVTPNGVTAFTAMQASNFKWLAPGAGGGGGGSGAVNGGNTSGAGGAGGAGGGCLVIQVEGNSTFSSTVVNCDGVAGSNGSQNSGGNGGNGAGGGGGGGGGGGTFIYLYNGTISGSPTISVDGGDGGDGGDGATGTGGYDGGAGGGGGASIGYDGGAGGAGDQDGSDGGGNSGSAGSQGAFNEGSGTVGGGGGGGGMGISLLAKNIAFA